MVAPTTLTVKAAAAELGVSAGLIYLLCSRGKLRHERHGLGRGTIRIPREALTEYREACCRGGAVTPAREHTAKRPVKLSHLRMPS